MAILFLEDPVYKLFISVISISELYAGVREGEEREALEDFLEAFIVLNVDHHIAESGGLYRQDYQKSHGTYLADALIAASVKAENLTLATLNKKHFPMIKNILFPFIIFCSFYGGCYRGEMHR